MERIVTVEEIIIDLPDGTIGRIPEGTEGDVVGEGFATSSGVEVEVKLDGYERTAWLYASEVRSV